MAEEPESRFLVRLNERFRLSSVFHPLREAEDSGSPSNQTKTQPHEGRCPVDQHGVLAKILCTGPADPVNQGDAYGDSAVQPAATALRRAPRPFITQRLPSESGRSEARPMISSRSLHVALPP